MSETVDTVLDLVRKMSDKERLDLIHSLMDNNLLFNDYEDLQDAMLIESRRHESTVNYMDFLDELRKEGKPV